MTLQFPTSWIRNLKALNLLCSSFLSKVPSESREIPPSLPNVLEDALDSKPLLKIRKWTGHRKPNFPEGRSLSPPAGQPAFMLMRKDSRLGLGSLRDISSDQMPSLSPQSALHPTGMFWVSVIFYMLCWGYSGNNRSPHSLRSHRSLRVPAALNLHWMKS